MSRSNSNGQDGDRAGSERMGGFGRYVGFDRDPGQEALTEAVSTESVERVWRRLEEQVEIPQRTRSASGAAAIVWGAATAAATFVVGVHVGREGAKSEELVSPSQQVVFQAPAAGRWLGQYGRPLGIVGPQRGTAERVAELTAPEDLSSPGKDEDVPEPPSLSSRRGEGRTRGRTGGRALTTVQEQPDRLGSNDGVGVAGSSPTGSSSSLVDMTPTSPPESSQAPAVSPRKSEPSRPEWQRWANGGEYDAALFELSRQGGFESVVQTASAEQLMLLVDVARATGQPQRAVAALRRVVSSFQGDPVAPLAAWSLGTLLERSGDPAGASQAFAVYRRLSPQGDFAEDALVREIRSAVQRGHRDEAQRLVVQYESTFGGGPRAKELASWVEGLVKPSGDELESDETDPVAADAGVPALEEERESSSEAPARQRQAAER